MKLNLFFTFRVLLATVIPSGMLYAQSLDKAISSVRSNYVVGDIHYGQGNWSTSLQRFVFESYTNRTYKINDCKMTIKHTKSRIVFIGGQVQKDLSYENVEEEISFDMSDIKELAPGYTWHTLAGAANEHTNGGPVLLYFSVSTVSAGKRLIRITREGKTYMVSEASFPIRTQYVGNEDWKETIQALRKTYEFRAFESYRAHCYKGTEDVWEEFGY